MLGQLPHKERVQREYYKSIQFEKEEDKEQKKEVEFLRQLKLKELEYENKYNQI